MRPKEAPGGLKTEDRLSVKYSQTTIRVDRSQIRAELRSGGWFLCFGLGCWSQLDWDLIFSILTTKPSPTDQNTQDQIGVCARCGSFEPYFVQNERELAKLGQAKGKSTGWENHKNPLDDREDDLNAQKHPPLFLFSW